MTDTDPHTLTGAPSESAQTPFEAITGAEHKLRSRRHDPDELWLSRAAHGAVEVALENNERRPSDTALARFRVLVHAPGVFPPGRNAKLSDSDAHDPHAVQWFTIPTDE